MKKRILSIALIAITLLLFSTNNAFAVKMQNPKQSNLVLTKKLPVFIVDDALVLKIEIVDAKRLLRVSFNGSEGPEGELKLYNASNEMVIESNFELIKSPFYATVDINTLAVGTYTAKLTTGTAVHTATLIIQ
jgi:hypothetical protein